jgi:PAS domain S-box-containing protein
VLVLEDRPEDADLMLHELRKADFDPAWDRVESEPEFLAHLAPELDLILADYHLPQFDALRALGLLKESGLDIPFIVVTGSISEEAAVSVMRQGASDYLLKDRLARLGPAVVHAIDQKRLRDEKGRTDFALNESERLYRALFQNAPIGLGLLDAEGRILALNAAILSAAGYSLGEASQLRDVAAFFEDPADAQGLLQILRQKGSVRQDSVHLKRKDGVGYDALLTITAVILGGRQCLQLMVEDITERKRAEEALRESESRLKEAQALGRVGSWEYDPVRQEITWSDETYELYERDPVLGPPTAEEEAAYYSPDQARVLREFARRALEEGQGSEYDLQAVLPSGKRVDYAARMQPVKDAHGRVTKLFGTVQDITERKRAEEALMESNAQFGTLFEASPDAILLIDPHDRWPILDCNVAACKMNGYTRDELVGQSIDLLNLMAGDLIEREEYVGRIRQSGVLRLDAFHRRKDGIVFPVEVSTSLITLGGRDVVLGIDRDITERRRSEEALRSSEERFRLLAENANDLIYRFRLTPPRGFEYVSPSAIRILGYTPEEIYANPDMGVETVVPEDRLLLEAATRTPEAFTRPLVMRWQRKDGTIAWVEQRSQPVYDGDSQLIAIQGIARDITERKLAEDEVRRRAAYLEGLNAVTLASTTAPDLPRLLDASLGQILKAMGLDQGAIFVHGCLVSRGFPDFMLQELKNLLPTHTLAIADQALMAVEDWQQPPPGPLERMAPLFRRIGMVATLAVAITTESEPVGAIAVASADPHPWSGEEVVLLEGIARQLGTTAERLHLLQQTEAQARQLQHILDTVPEGIVTVNQNGEVVLANPLARVYLDTLAQYGESENLLGLAFRPLSELQIPRSDGLPHEVVVPGPRPRIFEIRSSPAELAPAGGGKTLILHEVTEQREMRTATEHQERLAAIGQLAAGIAHDFNNIIAAIILHSELMLAEPGLSDKGLMRQRTILQQARRAASLTQQVLDFSRRAVLELRPIDLAPFVKETLKLLQRTLPESVQVSLSVEPGEYTIRADPARIQQVFMNLALNGRDAMPDGGQLRFELSHMRSEPGRSLPFPGMAAGEWLVARVEDTGTGISPDSLPHIFEPFFTTKPHGQGTGLGLSQAFGIVKQHGGFIDVGSRIGEGTTFTIYLPALTRQEAVATEVQVTGAPQGNGETILVVEDAASIRAAVCEILESLNYHTLQAADGEEALAVFEQHADRIDLVVSDLVMPEMGGQELSRALRRRRPGLKLILMTGYPLGGVTRELLQDQEFSWLQKPMSTLGLAEAVHKTLTGKGT